MKAREIYDSPLFIKSLRWAEKNTDLQFILSAKYGLIDLDTEIEPYDLTLNNMNIEKRLKWTKFVYNDLVKRDMLKNKFIILAGRRYYEFLEGMFFKDRINYQILMKDLPIGKRLEWLNKNT